MKVYNDHTLYEEWEFVFDVSKVKQIPNPNASGAGGTPADRMNNSTPQTQYPGNGFSFWFADGLPMGFGSPTPRPPGQ